MLRRCLKRRRACVLREEAVKLTACGNALLSELVALSQSPPLRIGGVVERELQLSVYHLCPHRASRRMMTRDHLGGGYPATTIADAELMYSHQTLKATVCTLCKGDVCD